MITKEELQDHIFISDEVKELQKSLEELEEQRYLISAVKIKGAPAGTGSADKIANNIAKLEQLEEYYTNKLNEKLSQLKRVEDAIERLPARERLLVRYRYINGYDWINIAAKMNYSWKQTHRIHAKALEKLKDDTQ